jgi:hypothetical protein
MSHLLFPYTFELADDEEISRTRGAKSHAQNRPPTLLCSYDESLIKFNYVVCSLYHKKAPYTHNHIIAEFSNKLLCTHKKQQQ